MRPVSMFFRLPSIPFHFRLLEARSLSTGKTVA